MTDNPADVAEKLRRELKDGTRGGSEVDREALLEVSNNIRRVQSKAGDYRDRDILRNCTIMSEQVDDVNLVETIDNREAAETFVDWIHATYNNEHTNQTYRKNLRGFGRYYLQQDDPPETLAWIPSGTSNNFDPVPSERDLLTHNEVKEMAESCKNPRDAALIMVQFEAGLRSGELKDLRVGDVYDSEHSVGLHVDGKKGEETVHLIVAVPYLQRWLSDHPASNDNSAWLWSKLNSPERPSNSTFLNYFKSAADRVGIDKEVTPTNFRKSNTRWLVVMGWSQPEIEDRQGRVRGSDHTAHYMARFGEGSLEESYAELHGKDVDTDTPEEVAPLVCPRCDRDTPRDRGRCMWCGFALSPKAVEEAETTREEGLQALAQLVSAENVEKDAAVETINGLIDSRVQAALEGGDVHD